MMDDVVPQTVLETIFAWSESRPLWQRYALRRIIVDGTPDEEALTCLLQICKKEHDGSVVEADYAVLEEAHLPVDPGEGESIRLASMGEIIGVNQLAANQTLSFNIDGITVIYGPNGSGKSGYSRVLKKACRSRHASSIIPDIYNPPPTGYATATLSVAKSDGTVTEYGWEDNGNDDPSDLSAITVFDRDCASVHLQKNNNVMFRPFGLDIPDDLAGVCQQLKDKLAAEKSILEHNRSAVFDTPHWSVNSSIGKVLSALSHDTDLAFVTPASSFSEEQESRLTALQSDLSKSPQQAAIEQRRNATRLAQMVAVLKRVAVSCSDETVQDLLLLKQTADMARETANVAASTAFSGLPIEGVGSPIWKGLWDAARNYSNVIGEEGVPFPPESGDTCVLCHQSISQDVARKMSGFEEFIQTDTETTANAAEVEFQEAFNLFSGRVYGIRQVGLARQFLATSNTELASTVLRCMASAKLRQKQFLAKVSDGTDLKLCPLAECPIQEVEDIISKINGYATSLEAGGDGEERVSLEKERDELLDLKQADSLLAVGTAEIERLKSLELIRKCMRDMNTRAITELGNRIADELITPSMRDQFQAEIVELVANRVRVEVVRSGGRFGSPQYEVRFLRKPDAPVGDILSEGEQTCVALSAYLTELSNASHTSALVFDDPVTSLDHRWRNKVAKRLVKEASFRQVVVFTHDLIFVNDLHELANISETPVSLANLTRTPDGVGVVNENLPWDKSGVPQRIDMLEKETRNAARILDGGDEERYRRMAHSIYNQLRSAWERGLEDIVFAGVLMRHRDYIKPKNLKKVTVLDDSDVATFQSGFEKCCDYVDAHDMSRGRDSEPPNPDEILADIESLKQWADNLKAKHKAI